MKILIFHMRFHPDAMGSAPMVSQLTEDLSAAGEQVSVIASLPHYGRRDVHPDYRDRQGLFHLSKHQGANIWRTPVYLPPRPTIFHRALNYLSYTFMSVIAGFRAGKADIVLAVNPPITTIFSAYLIALVRRVPLVVGIQDIWPDCVIQVGQLKNKYLIRISYWMERIQHRIASKVVVLSRGMKENLITKKVPEHKIVVIANWADPKKVKPLPGKNDFLRDNSLEDRFVILFAGNHGYNAALEVVLSAAEMLRSRPEVVFLFAGEGNVKADLQQQAHDHGLKNVIFVPTQLNNDYLEMLATAHIGLVTLRKALGGLSVPSKVYSLMAAARPILAAVPKNSGIESLVEDSGCGFCVAPEDPRALADAVESLLNRKEELIQMGRYGRDYLEQHVARHTQTGQYHQLLHELVSGGSSQ